MQAQSAVEFLVTYSFMFLILVAVITMIVFLIAMPSTAIPSQCGASGGPSCNFVYMYSNKSASYSLVTISIANSESVPINITGFSVTLNGNTYTGFCTPYFLQQGQQTTCAANTSYVGARSTAQGSYSISAQFCNSGVSSITSGACNYENVIYAGSFITSVAQKRVVVFSVVAAVGPSNTLLTSRPASPSIPSGFSILQNGEWIVNETNGNVIYAFGTSGSSGTALGAPIAQFPQSLSSLSNNAVACSAPYNSILTIASTTLYVSTSSGPTVQVDTDNAMEVYYRQKAPFPAWQNAFAGSAWSNAGGTFGPASMSMNNGVYSLSAEWTNDCGIGLQAMSVNGLPT